MGARKGSTRTILVVDDDPEIGEVLELAMSVEGYSVEVAQSHEAGLRLMREVAPAVILLDYYGLGGDPGQFVAQATSINSATPIVLMTSARTATIRARDLGINHVLAKPFDIESLLTLLQALDSGESGNSARAKP